MLMLKQIWNEIWYTSKDKKSIGILAIEFVLSLLFRDWAVTYIAILSHMSYMANWKVVETTPEIIGFLPMERKAKQQYVCVKAYIVSAMVALFTEICMLISLIPRDGMRVNQNAVWFSGIIAVTIFLVNAEKLVLGENAQHRKAELKVMKQMCIPKWCQIFDKIVVCIVFVVVMSGFLGAMNYEESETFLFTWEWRVAIILMLATIIIGHVIIMRYYVQIIDMGDYNAKADNQEVGYEY